MGYLIFVDTNILLDFYRASNDVNLEALKQLDQHRNSIITTHQVEMEFKKNRQLVIFDAVKNMAPSDSKNVPAFFKQTKSAKAATRNKQHIDRLVKSLKERAHKLLLNPTTVDPVYKAAQRLFCCKSPYNLTREMPERRAVRRLAWKRFMLGYPPRKKADTSIGDCVNWEWIIHCALQSGLDIAIISRDEDYGIKIQDEMFVNDWLMQEFRGRVSRKRKLQLVGRLTSGLKLLDVPVSQEQEEAEQEMLAAPTSGTSDSHDPQYPPPLNKLLGYNPEGTEP